MLFCFAVLIRSHKCTSPPNDSKGLGDSVYTDKAIQQVTLIFIGPRHSRVTRDKCIHRSPSDLRRHRALDFHTDIKLSPVKCKMF